MGNGRRGLDRQPLASGLNALQFLSYIVSSQLELPHHSVGKPQTQWSPACQGLWFGCSQRLSVTHPTKSQVHGYGCRIPSRALQAQFTLPLGVDLCINNADDEQSTTTWLEKIFTWMDKWMWG